MLTKLERPIQCLTLAARRDTKTAVRILLCVSLHFSCAADTCQLKGDRSLFIVTRLLAIFPTVFNCLRTKGFFPSFFQG